MFVTLEEIRHQCQMPLQVDGLDGAIVTSNARVFKHLDKDRYREVEIRLAKGKYPIVSLDGTVYFLSRLVKSVCDSFGMKFYEKKEGFRIAYKDGNPANCDYANLSWKETNEKRYVPRPKVNRTGDIFAAITKVRDGEKIKVVAPEYGFTEAALSNYCKVFEYFSDEDFRAVCDERVKVLLKGLEINKKGE